MSEEKPKVYFEVRRSSELRWEKESVFDIFSLSCDSAFFAEKILDIYVNILNDYKCLLFDSTLFITHNYIRRAIHVFNYPTRHIICVSLVKK